MTDGKKNLRYYVRRQFVMIGHTVALYVVRVCPFILEMFWRNVLFLGYAKCTTCLSKFNWIYTRTHYKHVSGDHVDDQLTVQLLFVRTGYIDWWYVDTFYIYFCFCVPFICSVAFRCDTQAFGIVHKKNDKFVSRMVAGQKVVPILRSFSPVQICSSHSITIWDRTVDTSVNAILKKNMEK